MNAPWFASPEWLALVHALLHTLWQGALAAGGLLLALRMVPVQRADLRYGLAVGALLVVLVMGLVTWAVLETPSVPLSAKATPPAVRATEPEAKLNVALSTGAPSASQTQGDPVLSSMPATRSWSRWVAALWLVGVMVCLVRTLRETVGAGRLRRRCEVLKEPVILALAEELRGCLRLSRRVRLMVSRDIGVPSVMGILSPVILLPAAMLTGIPVEAWRAILAHELAHVRRWDYLANLGQMLIEALLFFNPFVWWISRQIRMEREACCDQLAAGECQSPARYVHALLAVIERSRALGGNVPAPVLAATGTDRDREGNVVDRARRLLVPGYLPALRLRWFSLAAVLILFGVGLMGLWTGTRAIAQTIQAPERPAQAEGSADGQVLVMVKVVDEAGRPMEETSGMVVYWHTTGPRGLSAASAVPSDRESLAPVWVDADSASVSLAAVADGYAPAFAGPFSAPVKEKLAGLKFTLTRGFSAAIQVVNETGEPVAGAKLEGHYPGPPAVAASSLKTQTVGTTDAAGEVTLQHIGTAALSVRLQADGYEADEIASIRLDPAQPYRWTVKKAKVLSGMVTATDGRLIAGAKIKLAGVRGPQNQTHYDPTAAPVLTASDAQGRFALTTLRPDSRYYLFVDAPGFSGVFVSGLRLQDGELKVALGPPRLVAGRIINIPPSVIHLGKLRLSYGQTFEIGENSSFHASHIQEFDSDGAEQKFSVGPFYVPQGERESSKQPLHLQRPIGISVDGRARADFGVEDLPISDYVLDLGPEPKATAEPAAPAKAEAKPSAARAVQVQGTVSTVNGALPDSEGTRIKAAYTLGPGAGGGATGYFNTGVASGFNLSVPSKAVTLMIAATNSSVQFKSVTLQLEVVPLIDADREVDLDILQKNDEVSGSTRIDNNDIPTIATRYVRTHVTVPDRETRGLRPH